MEKQKTIQKPEFITREQDGEFFLEVKIPKELEKELEEEVKKLSGTIVTR